MKYDQMKGDRPSRGIRFEPRLQKVLDALPRRVKLAFPELARLFALLVLGHGRGQGWRRTFDAYTEPMSLRTLDRLAGEFDDLFSIADSDRTFEILATVLGLDLAVADGEYPSLYQLIATIEERLSGERLARRAARQSERAF